MGLLRSHSNQHSSYDNTANLSPKEKKILMKRFPQPTSQLVTSAEPMSPSNRSRIAEAYDQHLLSSQQSVMTSQEKEEMERLRRQIEQSGEFVVVRKEELDSKKDEKKIDNTNKKQDRSYTRSRSRCDEDDNWRRKSDKS